ILPRPRSRHIALAVCTALFLSASGSTDTAPKETADGDWETVTIESTPRSGTIEDEPARIVTPGQGASDTAISLATTPVGMEEYPWGSDDTGYLPWIYEEVNERGDELPEQFAGATELDIEATLELQPDLILAPWSGVTQEQYDLLADIAPTV